MDTKTRPIYMLSTRDPLQIQGHIQTGSEGRVKGFHANGNQKKAGVAILTSDKTDFKIKSNRRQGHYIVIKGSIIQEEDTTTIYMYVSDIGARQYKRQMLKAMKEKSIVTQ